MAKVKCESVDAYLAAQPEANRAALELVRATIRKALPKRAEEVISYQIPAYKVDGERVVYFAGWKQHFSLYPVTAPAATAFEKELARYEKSTGTVRFPLDEQVPVRLVSRITKFLAEQAAERAAVKAAKKAAKKPAVKKPAAKKR
ncbi:MAG: DUF1801 domain-containing protein [Acidobacteria bacterium]|nr:DUF1801 domain-containing protein [Acidobacteriota bacterium]